MALVTDLLNWLQELPQPGLVAAAGGFVFAECMIGLGVIAPGETGLLVAATTATSMPRFVILWAVVTVCATVGDTISYRLGRKFGPRLRETKLIRKYGADAWDRAGAVLERRGAWAVFFARFLPVLRTLLPAAAGASRLPFRKFLPATALGALCWSLAHISLGAALGEAAKQVEDALSTGFLVVAAVIVGVVLFFLLRLKKRKTLAEPEPTEEDTAGTPKWQVTRPG